MKAFVFTAISFLFCLSHIYSQNSNTFSNQQFKLSIGPAKGQPPLFASFDWSKGFGASVEYNKQMSKRFSWGCELGFTFDTDYIKTNFYNFNSTNTGELVIEDTEIINNFMRTTYSVIPQITYHFLNKRKINIGLTGGFGLMSENFSHTTLSPNGLYIGNRQRSFSDLIYIVHFALSIDYKVSPNVFIGLKLQDHIFSTEREFRSLRASIGYVIK